MIIDDNQRQEYRNMVKWGLMKKKDYEEITKEKLPPEYEPENPPPDEPAASVPPPDVVPPSPAPPPPPPSEAAEWHIVVNGAQQGPFTKAALGGMFARGEITRQTQVWNPRMTEWAAAETKDELNDILPAPTPPPVAPPDIAPTYVAPSPVTVDENVISDELLARMDAEKAAKFEASFAEAKAERDRDKRFLQFEALAEDGYAPAQYELARHLMNKYEATSEDKDKGIEWLRKAAGQGYAEAQQYLGMLFYIGKVVAKDRVQAFEWYRKAAEQGNAAAQHSLGGYYSTGTEVVKKDEAKGFEWYRKAAEQGYADAQFYLGGCYKLGTGTAKDYAQAAKWYGKASEQKGTFTDLAKKYLEELKAEGKI